MAYNNYYPQFYQPIQPIYPQVQANNTQNQQIQNGGFVSIPNENMVSSYPVAPGNCVTFKVEGKPIVMEKSMGFSQLESPKIERYRLVKEDAPEEPIIELNTSNELVDRLNEKIESLESDIGEIWGELDVLKKAKEPVKKKRITDGED